MAIRMDEYLNKLINSILSANSQEEVIKSIDTTVKDLAKKQGSGDLVNGFAEKMTDALGLFTPMKKDAQQWSNITMARIHLNRIKNELNSTAS